MTALPGGYKASFQRILGVVFLLGFVEPKSVIFHLLFQMLSSVLSLAEAAFSRDETKRLRFQGDDLLSKPWRGGLLG